MVVAYPVAALVHLADISAQLYWGIPALAWYDVFSAVIYIVIAVISRQRDKFVLGTVMALIEFSTYTFATIYYLGWGLGVQFFFTPFLVGILLLPERTRIKLLLVSGILAAFVGQYAFARWTTPQLIIPTTELELISFVNISMAFGLALLAALYFTRLIQQAETALAAAHARSEALLYNVLPVTIAERLKQQPVVIADHFPGASILFADIVGFTALSHHIAPQALVQLLNTIFSRFDVLVAQYGLEKIKTIGDAYMVAAGVPVPRADHAEAVANLALAMRETLAAYNRETGSTLQMRIGLNTGPVIAGVIGQHRFLYDLWGDSVNTASRMESHGVPNEIQVAEPLAVLLHDKFVLEDRGEIEVKGQGKLRTYFLRGRLG